MKREEIREVVIMTIRELERARLLRRADDVAYSEISSRLYEYYKNPAGYPDIQRAIDNIRDDPYFEIIPRYYSQKIYVDTLSQMYGCDISTIARNKKRLCLQIYMDARKEAG